MGGGGRHCLCATPPLPPARGRPLPGRSGDNGVARPGALFPRAAQGASPAGPAGDPPRSDPARGSCCEDPGSESPRPGSLLGTKRPGAGAASAGPCRSPPGRNRRRQHGHVFSSKTVDYNRIKDFPGGWTGCDPRAVPARSSVPPGPPSLPSRTTGGAAAPTAPAPHAPRRAGLREELLHGGCALWAWKDEIWCFTGMEEDESAPQGVLLRGPGACR